MESRAYEKTLIIVNTYSEVSTRNIPINFRFIPIDNDYMKVRSKRESKVIVKFSENNIENSRTLRSGNKMILLKFLYILHAGYFDCEVQGRRLLLTDC